MKFKFGDLVIVKEGFYAGCRGIVIDRKSSDQYLGSCPFVTKINYVIEIMKKDKLGISRAKNITEEEGNIEIPSRPD